MPGWVDFGSAASTMPILCYRQGLLTGVGKHVASAFRNLRPDQGVLIRSFAPLAPPRNSKGTMFKPTCTCAYPRVAAILLWLDSRFR